MPDLYITKIKPNPVGSDRSRHDVPNQQLAAEWVDFKNTTSRTLSLQNVQIWNIAYTAAHPVYGEWKIVTKLNGNLNAGETVRIHSGGTLPLSSLAFEDRLGADEHIFTGSGHVWNNTRSDSPRIVLVKNAVVTEIDKATYFANPPEGKILMRRADELVSIY